MKKKKTKNLLYFNELSSKAGKHENFIPYRSREPSSRIQSALCRCAYCCKAGNAGFTDRTSVQTTNINTIAAVKKPVTFSFLRISLSTRLHSFLFSSVKITLDKNRLLFRFYHVRKISAIFPPRIPLVHFDGNGNRAAGTFCFSGDKSIPFNDASDVLRYNPAFLHYKNIHARHFFSLVCKPFRHIGNRNRLYRNRWDSKKSAGLQTGRERTVSRNGVRSWRCLGFRRPFRNGRFRRTGGGNRYRDYGDRHPSFPAISLSGCRCRCQLRHPLAQRLRRSLRRLLVPLQVASRGSRRLLQFRQSREERTVFPP